MKKFFLLFCLLASSNIIASDLDSLGLSELQILPDSAGNEIRGTSSFGYSSGLSSISLFLYDPATSSTLNANAINRSIGNLRTVTAAGFSPSLIGKLGETEFSFSGTVFTFGAVNNNFDFSSGGSGGSGSGGSGSGGSGSGGSGGNGNGPGNGNGNAFGLTPNFGLGNN